MATKINSAQILDGAVTRNDLNTTITGQAVTTKITQGANITLTSTGVDSGTGDVKVVAVPSGSSGQVQFNSTGTFAGATKVTVGSSGSLILSPDTSPTTPSANSVSILPNTIANKGFVRVLDSTGTISSLQASFARNRIGLVIPHGGGGNGITVIGVTVASVGSQALRSSSAGSFVARLRRLGWGTSSTAGTMAEYRQNNPSVTAGTGTAGLGGFLYISRFVPGNFTAVSGERFYNGMSSATVAATNVEPNTQTNHIGIAQLSTDSTQFYWVYGGSSSQASIACGTAVGSPSGLSTQAFELTIYAPSAISNTYYAQLTNIETGVSVSQTFSGDAATVPQNNTVLGFKLWKTNNATAASATFDVVSIYLETDN